MLKENLTFNDLPEMVGRLYEKIESLENALKESLAKEPSVKENLHVPMTVEEVCSYLGISKSSFYYKAKHGGISRRTGQMAGDRKKKPGAAEHRGGTRADTCRDKT